jgi:hypothetical protein
MECTERGIRGNAAILMSDSPAASAMSRTAQVDKAQPLLLDLPGWTAEQRVIDKAKSKMN